MYPEKYEAEDLADTLLLRPKMNLFSIKLQYDGVEIAKNSAQHSVDPLLFTIEGIAALDDVEDWEEAWKGRIPIPVRYADPAIITISHCIGKPNQFQALDPSFDELEFLHPASAVPDGKVRRCCVVIYCIICDTPMVAWMTGKICHCLICFTESTFALPRSPLLYLLYTCIYILYCD